MGGCHANRRPATGDAGRPSAAGQANGTSSHAPHAAGSTSTTTTTTKAARSGHPKTLSSYNKTKGGSMLINMSHHSTLDEVSTDFVDEQGITSPAKPDWKVSKTIKRAPEMHESVSLPVDLPADPSRLLAVRVGYKTLQGRNPRPPHKPNQDALTIFKPEGRSDCAVFAVFDGHGPFGEHASHFMRSRLHPSMAAREGLVRTDARAALVAGLDEVHKQFCSDATLKAGVDPVVSGTTCVCVMFEADKLHVANVGDSRAILGTRDPETREMKVVELTDDHKPQRPDERARLEKSSALLLTEREVRGFGDDSKIYICREKGGDIVYGVLFTRSLGDLDAHNHLGVSAEPEMGERVLSDRDEIIVLASDGVWDYMTNQEVLDLCAEHADPLKAAEAITVEATDRWDKRDTDHRRDDITALVLRVSREPNPAHRPALPPSSEEAPEEQKKKEEMTEVVQEA